MDIKDMKVFPPIEIKGMKLKNRIGFAPMGNNPGRGGFVTDDTIRWFEKPARGGAGFVMTGITTPSAAQAKSGKGAQLNLWDDKYIEGFAKIAEAVHSHGAKLGSNSGYSVRYAHKAFLLYPILMKSMPGLH